MTVLDEIVTNKRLEIEAQKQAVSLESMAAAAYETSKERRPFRALFDETSVLIAEVKPKSPSAGQLIPSQKYGHGVSIFEVAELYAKGEADVISVLTDEKYFGGSLSLLSSVRSSVPQTVLRKEFIIDPYQIFESAAAGADAMLLIAAILSRETLATFIQLGAGLGIDSLVEVHDEEDVEKALSARATVIGINNRDLRTLKVDLANTERLAGKIPVTIPVVSESGIETADDVRRVRAAGARGILVGTSILRSPDPVGKISEFKSALSA